MTHDNVPLVGDKDWRPDHPAPNEDPSRLKIFLFTLGVCAAAAIAARYIRDVIDLFSSQ